MDNRKNIAIQIIVQDLKLLRRGTGVNWSAYSRTKLLQTLVGGNISDFTKRLAEVVNTYARDDKSVDCTLIALNIDDGRSNNDLMERRKEAMSMYEISERTVTRREDDTLLHIAQGLVVKHDATIANMSIQELSYMAPDPKSRESTTVLDSLIAEKISCIETSLSELKILLSKSKGDAIK